MYIIHITYIETQRDCKLHSLKMLTLIFFVRWDCRLFQFSSLLLFCIFKIFYNEHFVNSVISKIIKLYVLNT